METVKEVKDLTLNLIKDLDIAQLLQVAESLQLEVKEEKKSRKEAIQNVILRHLSSENVEDSADEGLALYKQVSEQVSGILDAQYEDRMKLAALKDMTTAGGSRMSKMEMKLKDAEEDENRESNEEELLERLLKMKVEALQSKSGKTGKKKISKNNALEKLLLEYEKRKLLESDDSDGHSSSDEDGADEKVAKRTVREKERTEMKRMKLKDFKIDGGVIGGEKNSLDYCSLRFQMEEGLHQGYTEKEVRTGVIKSIKAGTVTRGYFERKAHTLTHQEFLKTLRTLYDNSDTNDLVDEMIERVQEKGETEKEYLMAMFELRDNINEVTQGDEEPLGKKFVQKRMLRAISVGLRKDTVRLEMQDSLKDVKKSDNQLLAEVKEVVSRDTENKKKMKRGGVNVNALSGFSDNEGEPRSRSLDRGKGNRKTRSRSVDENLTRSREHPSSTERRVAFNEPLRRKDDQSIASVLAIVNVLQTDLQEHTKTVAALQKQVADLMAFISNHINPDNPPPTLKPKQPFLRCTNCEATKSFCTHCTKCNESGHKRFNCPKNK